MSPGPVVPSISVVIPAYNAARWISEAISSVLEQICRDYELIVVDDGSTDDTPEVLARWGNRIRYFRQNNAGTASARNLGIGKARGRFIAFLDADDVWLPGKLERQLECFRRHPQLAWCYANALFFDDRTGRHLHTQSQIQQQLQGDILRPLLLSDFIPVSTVMVKRSAFAQVGVFDLTWPACEDWDMWLRLAARYPVGYLREPLAKYRVHGSQKSQATKLKQILEERLAVVEAAVRRDPERLTDLRILAKSNVYTNVGWVWFNQDDLPEARRLFQRAVLLCPTSVRAWVYWLASFVPKRLLEQMITLLRAFRKFAREDR